MEYLAFSLYHVQMGNLADWFCSGSQGGRGSSSSGDSGGCWCARSYDVGNKSAWKRTEQLLADAIIAEARIYQWLTWDSGGTDMLDPLCVSWCAGRDCWGCPAPCCTQYTPRSPKWPLLQHLFDCWFDSCVCKRTTDNKIGVGPVNW